MRRAFGLLLFLTAGACESEPATDAGLFREPDAGPPPRAHCVGADLLIAEIDPGATITIFNPTGEPVALAGTEWVLCQRPNYVALDTIEPGVTIAPRGAHTFELPGSFADPDEGGEVALYSMSAFTVASAQADFVCWGAGRTSTRIGVAEQDGDWVGECAPAVTGDSLRRIPGTDGHGAASYDPTGTAGELICP